MRSSLLSNPSQAQNSSVPMMATTNPTGLPYNGIPNPINNAMHSTIPMTQLPQHHQYQQPPPTGRVVSPVASPMLPREQIIIQQHSPPHVPNQLGTSPVRMNQNAMAWQHHQQLQQQQQQFQLNAARSYDSEEMDKIETGSDVSSIHMGSIRPDPNYDPAKDPLSPEHIDKPFVAPLEITIRVVKARRRKTLGSNQSSTTHTTHTTLSTAGSTRYSVEEDKYQIPTNSEWLHSPPRPTTHNGSGSMPELGPINSFVSDATDSNSFSGSADQFQSAEERMYLEEDLLEIQEGQAQNEETKQRKGMVRREFNRRIMRFKKNKNKKKNSINQNNNTSNEISGESNDDESDASGNKIIIQLSIDDEVDNKNNIIPEQPPHKHNFHLGKNLYPTTFKLKHHRRSNSMKMIVGQENGC
mmetsp:Transcript_18561/g.38248  ORF Transcript_18561/g.38248 Transcript_18561/m.38248 type:complete len:412 (+) Transcript_18561:506-1741(+)